MSAPHKVRMTTFDFEEAARAVSIDVHDLQGEFVRVPSDIAHYGSLAADALENALSTKRQLEAGEGQVRMEYKQSQKDRVTEAFLDSCVVQDPRYRVLREQADRADVLRVRAVGVCTALQAKKEMLISLGAHIRAEMQTNLTIRS